MSRYIPERGDIAWIDFNPEADHEQANRRPALVLSSGRYNSLAKLAVVCPISRKEKGYPFEVKLPAASRVEGVVMSDQIRSVAWDVRRAEFMESAPAELLDQVLARISALLGF